LFTFGASSAFGSDIPAPGPEPTYNTQTEIEVTGVIGGVHEILNGVLVGVYLTVKTKTADVELYLGPSKFIKMFDVQFKNEDDIKAIGSKVKFEDKDLVLAREVEIGKITLTLRDVRYATMAVDDQASCAYEHLNRPSWAELHRNARICRTKLAGTSTASATLEVSLSSWWGPVAA